MRLYLKLGLKEDSPPTLWRVRRETKRRESKTRSADRMWQKNKNLLGLVSNLQQLSSHQRKTAYGEGTVRGCLLKRITALKGSEAKQRYEFRCSRGVPGRGDNTIESAQTLKKYTVHLFIYSSTHHSIHPSIYCFYFFCVCVCVWEKHWRAH